jgi:hypothetical protein
MAIYLKGTNILSSNDVTSSGILTQKVNRDGLVLYIDSANNDSLGDSGAILDLSDQRNNLTSTLGTRLIGGSNAWEFSSDGHYASGTVNGLITPYEITLETWLYPAPSEITSGDRGTVILLTGGRNTYMSWNKSSSTISNYWYDHQPNGYHEQFGAVSRGAWHHFCAVWDNRNLHQWVDGEYGVVKGVTGSSTPNTGINIGRESSGRQFSGYIAVVRVYNRALNGYEVMENFNAEKGRFGV